MSAWFVCLCSRQHTWQWNGLHCVLRLPQQPAECPLPVPAGAYYYGNAAGMYQEHTHPVGPRIFRFIKIHTLLKADTRYWMQVLHPHTKRMFTCRVNMNAYFWTRVSHAHYTQAFLISSFVIASNFVHPNLIIFLFLWLWSVHFQ